MRILIIDDHAAIIGMMTQVVESIPGFRVAGTALDGESARRICRDQPPDIIILDLVLPKISGLTLLRDLGALCPQAHIMIFTGYLTVTAMRGVLAAGARCVVEKTERLEVFRDALQAVALGQTYFGPSSLDLMRRVMSEDSESEGRVKLSGREKIVLSHVAQGLSSKEIADKLGIGLHAVINDRSNLMKKTGLRRVAQLSVYAMQTGLAGEVKPVN